MPKVKAKKIIKAERDKVFSIATDFESFPTKLPQYFNSVKIISRDNNSITTEENIKIAGKDITQQSRHVLTPPEVHEVFVVEGDAKDSHIIERYETISEGTKVVVEGDIKLAGKLKVLGFFAKGKIEKRMEKMLEQFAKIVEDREHNV